MWVAAILAGWFAISVVLALFVGRVLAAGGMGLPYVTRSSSSPPLSSSRVTPRGPRGAQRRSEGRRGGGVERFGMAREARAAPVRPSTTPPS
jgi:hypothetical protein